MYNVDKRKQQEYCLFFARSFIYNEILILSLMHLYSWQLRKQGGGNKYVEDF